MSRTLDVIEYISSAASVDVREARDLIAAEYDNASKKERVLLLQTFNAVMDLAERNLEPERAAQLHAVRMADYRQMLLSECLDSAGLAVPQLLEAVTRREVDAGRMQPDDDFRTFAISGAATFSAVPTARPRKGFLARIFSRMSK